MSEQQAFGFADGYSSEYCDNAVSISREAWPGALAGCLTSPIEKHSRLDPNDSVFGSHANSSGVEPQGFKILVEMVVPAEIQRFRDSGLAVPENVLSRYTAHAMVAKVVQIGRGCYRPDRYPEGPWCKPGDFIAMAPYSGTRIYSKIHERDYRLINEDTVDAVIIGPEAVEAGTV